MLNILVTGSSGLVGSALFNILEKFQNESENINKINLIRFSSKDANLCVYDTSYEYIKQLHNTMPIDGIIHLAANVGGLFKNMAYPVEMIQDNLLMNTNILKIAHELNINNVIVCLSTCIFPDTVASYPISIEDLHSGPPHHSNEGYAYAKRLCDSLTRAYQKQYGCRYFCIVPTNIYGPHDNFDLHDAHVIPALIHKCWVAKKNNEQFIIAGTGSPLRQFIFSEDLAYLILWSYFNYTNIEKPLILCPPNSEVSISNIVTHIAELFDYKNNIIYDVTKPNGQYKKTAQSLSVEEINYTFKPIEEGLRITINWFNTQLKNNKNIRGVII